MKNIPETEEEIHHSEKDMPVSFTGNTHSPQFLVPRIEAHRLSVFLREGFYDTDAGDRLIEMRR